MATKKTELELEYRKRNNLVQINFLLEAELKDKLNEACKKLGISHKMWLKGKIEEFIAEVE